MGTIVNTVHNIFMCHTVAFIWNILWFILMFPTFTQLCKLYVAFYFKPFYVEFEIWSLVTPWILLYDSSVLDKLSQKLSQMDWSHAHLTTQLKINLTLIVCFEYSINSLFESRCQSFNNNTTVLFLWQSKIMMLSSFCLNKYTMGLTCIYFLIVICVDPVYSLFSLCFSYLFFSYHKEDELYTN